MRLRSHLTTLSLALGVAGLNAPVHAQAPDPCALYLCMASISGQGTPPANCASTLAYWHIAFPGGLAVYTPNGTFVPNKSYNVRQQYMNQCSGATDTANNSNIFNTIMNLWGRVQ